MNNFRLVGSETAGPFCMNFVKKWYTCWIAFVFSTIGGQIIDIDICRLNIISIKVEKDLLIPNQRRITDNNSKIFLVTSFIYTTYSTFIFVYLITLWQRLLILKKRIVNDNSCNTNSLKRRKLFENIIAICFERHHTTSVHFR